MNIHRVTIRVVCGCGASIVAQYGSGGGDQDIALRVGPCQACRVACIEEFKDKAREMAGDELQGALRDLRKAIERAELMAKGETRLRAAEAQQLRDGGDLA
ncbi:hypothetical protein LCGC14_1925510 [marine sediment metagenome]|uniref:Uncharacterized protein n=1 Tax=marine sediment metagenome TaxID=412755 RepID=A0A0F9FPE6_9ZZZZ